MILPQVRSHLGVLAVPPSRVGTAGDTTQTPQSCPQRLPGLPRNFSRNPTLTKGKKKTEKWRQAGVSNPKVLVFIQTRAQHCSVPNAPTPFFFCLREIHISARRGAWSPELLPERLCASAAPALAQLCPSRTNSKIHSAGFCQLPEFWNPPPQRCRGEGREGGAAALPPSPPPTALTETLF